MPKEPHPNDEDVEIDWAEEARQHEQDRLDNRAVDEAHEKLMSKL